MYTSKMAATSLKIAEERVPKIKPAKLWTYVQSGSTLPTWCPSMDKNKFGQILFCLPYLPLQKVWTFWDKNLLVISTYFRFFLRKNFHSMEGRLLDVKLPH